MKRERRYKRYAAIAAVICVSAFVAAVVASIADGSADTIIGLSVAGLIAMLLHRAFVIEAESDPADPLSGLD